MRRKAIRSSPGSSYPSNAARSGIGASVPILTSSACRDLLPVWPLPTFWTRSSHSFS
jgi:hypothetical protein